MALSTLMWAVFCLFVLLWSFTWQLVWFLLFPSTKPPTNHHCCHLLLLPSSKIGNWFFVFCCFRFVDGGGTHLTQRRFPIFPLNSFTRCCYFHPFFLLLSNGLIFPSSAIIIPPTPTSLFAASDRFRRSWTFCTRIRPNKIMMQLTTPQLRVDGTTEGCLVASTSACSHHWQWSTVIRIVLFWRTFLDIPLS